MSTALTPVAFDQEAVLRSLQLDPRNPRTQALLVVCQRYGLDPLLGHMVLIQGRPYITRDGYLHVAHTSGRLDGIELVEEGETDSHWWARVAVYRKDMGHPFVYRGRYPKAGSGNKQYGPEMALKCAEVAALRRAFNVSGAGAVDERWDDDAVEVQPARAEPEAVTEALEALAEPAPNGARGADWVDGLYPREVFGECQRLGLDTVGELSELRDRLREATTAVPPVTEPERKPRRSKLERSARAAKFDDAGLEALASFASAERTRVLSELNSAEQATALVAVQDFHEGRKSLFELESGALVLVDVEPNAVVEQAVDVPVGDKL